jgi:hypothetical protein
MNDEGKAKVSAKLRGRPLTPEHRAAVSRGLLGAVPAHGTRARYKRGCKCPECALAYRLYGREAQRRSRERRRVEAST